MCGAGVMQASDTRAAVHIESNHPPCIMLTPETHVAPRSYYHTTNWERCCCDLWDAKNMCHRRHLTPHGPVRTARMMIAMLRRTSYQGLRIVPEYSGRTGLGFLISLEQLAACRLPAASQTTAAARPYLEATRMISMRLQVLW
jgi:hypothetical protein